MPYPNGLLETRSIVKPGEYAIIPPEGRVNNVIPGISDCDITILCSPKIQAGFAKYVGTANENGCGVWPQDNTKEEVESLIWVMTDGELTVTIDGKTEVLTQGGYAYAPPSSKIEFKNTGNTTPRFILYKQKYISHPDPAIKPWVVFGNTNNIEPREYDGMANVTIQDLLPVEEAFDMNFHILSFLPGGCHPFIETHVQEHGAYIYEGEGVYLLGEKWTTVKKEDFIWFGPFVQQACYAVGRTPLTYIYSKDCHRDVIL